MAKRSRWEIVQAVRRVQGEELIDVAKLAYEIGVTKESVVRWIIEGRWGVFLDGFRNPERGWLSSTAALERFCEAIDAKSAAKQAAT